MTDSKNIARQLLKVKAVQLRPEEPYTWASGWFSPIYCDNRKLLSYPAIRKDITQGIADIIKLRYSDADAIVGVATAGIAWGVLVAEILALPFLYVRPKPKVHGMGNQIEGAYTTGQKVVVIEDLISTGKSSLAVCDVLNVVNLDVLGMVSIFNYGFPEAEKAFKNASVDIQSLCTFPTLLELAVEEKIITSDTLKTLLNWQENPSSWSK